MVTHQWHSILGKALASSLRFTLPEQYGRIYPSDCCHWEKRTLSGLGAVNSSMQGQRKPAKKQKRQAAEASVFKMLNIKVCKWSTLCYGKSHCVLFCLFPCTVIQGVCFPNWYVFRKCKLNQPQIKSGILRKCCSPSSRVVIRWYQGVVCAVSPLLGHMYTGCVQVSTLLFETASNLDLILQLADQLGCPNREAHQVLLFGHERSTPWSLLVLCLVCFDFVLWGIHCFYCFVVETGSVYNPGSCSMQTGWVCKKKNLPRSTCLCLPFVC